MSSQPSKVKPIPDEYEAPTAYLCVSDAAQAIDFYRKAFGAEETLRIGAPGGKVGHADLKLGRGHIMLADEYPDIGFVSPKSLGGTPVHLMIYVPDVDRVYRQAVAAGAKALRPVENQFYGDRLGQVEDPFGHRWSIATHVEDVPNDELERRAEKAHKG